MTEPSLSALCWQQATYASRSGLFEPRERAVRQASPDPRPSVLLSPSTRWLVGIGSVAVLGLVIARSVRQGGCE